MHDEFSALAICQSCKPLQSISICQYMGKYITKINLNFSIFGEIYLHPYPAVSTKDYSRLTVLPLTRYVKSTLNWSYEGINTASVVISRNSDKNPEKKRKGFCAFSCYCTKQVLCNKHFLMQVCYTQTSLQLFC